MSTIIKKYVGVIKNTKIFVESIMFHYLYIRLIIKGVSLERTQISKQISNRQFHHWQSRSIRETLW